jgi:hypothetical protein
MLSCVDRIQLAVPARDAAARGFARLLGAERVGEDRVATLAARRTRLRAGRSEVELLEPDGEGEVARAVRANGAALFAAGFAAPEPARLRERLRASGVTAHEEHGQLFLGAGALGAPGLRAVISPEAVREPAGLLSFLYEVTLLVPDWKGAADAFAERAGLDPAGFVPIRSAEYGYEGTLALFREGALDRVEAVTPFDAAKTMGRFFAQRGPALYMAYAESDRTHELRERLLADAPSDWTGPRDAPVPDNLFVHPRALGGLLLGVSRTSFAWIWSGRPERVQPARDGAR